MLGWINSRLKAFVVEKFGEEAWRQVVEKANVDDNWVSTCPYSDSYTYK